MKLFISPLHIVCFALVIVGLVSCAFPKPAKVIMPLTCLHPLANGGQPFEVPGAYHFFSGGIVATTPQGTEVTMYGAFCIKVTE